MKAYIILGNNRDTQELIDHVRGKDNGTITIVDENLESGLYKRGDLTYIGSEYVESIQYTNTYLSSITTTFNPCIKEMSVSGGGV